MLIRDQFHEFKLSVNSPNLTLIYSQLSKQENIFCNRTTKFRPGGILLSTFFMKLTPGPGVPQPVNIFADSKTGHSPLEEGMMGK